MRGRRLFACLRRRRRVLLLSELIITITTFNRQNYLALLLSSLLNQSYQDWDLLIIDNGSSTPVSQDPLIKTLVKRLSFNRVVQIKRFDENLGIARARKLILPRIKKAWKYAFDLNDDHYLDSKCVENLMSVISSNKRVGVVGTATPNFSNDISVLRKEYKGERLNTLEVRTHNGVRQVFLHRSTDFIYTQGKKLMSKPIEVVHCSQFIYRLSAVNESELIDYSLLGFTEETDLCLNVLRSGYKIYFMPSAVNWHLFGESGTRSLDPFKRIELTYADTKAFLDKHYDFIKERQEFWGVIKQDNKVWWSER